MDDVVAELTADGAQVRRVPVDYASHSRHVEEIADDLHRVLAPVTAGRPEVPMLSTVTGEWVSPGQVDADYWYENLRRTVRFAEATATLREQDHDVFIEMSPHTVLLPAIQQTLEQASGPTVVAGSLRRNDGGLRRFLTSLAEVHVRGVPVAFPSAGDTVELPAYAFQRRRYWLESTVVVGSADAVDLPADTEDDLAARLAGLPAERREEELLAFVRTATAGVLGHDDSDEIADDDSFFDIGFTSLTAVELRNRLSETSGMALPTMLLFDQPTPAMVAEYLAQRMELA
jgi:acyl transferase domain-containing protein